MVRRSAWLVVVMCLLWLASVHAEAQQPAASLGAALHSLASRADGVFVGQVVAIHRRGSAVEVQFRVDNAISGRVSGPVYTLREWAGLWPAGMQRYHVGDHAMVFAQAQSAAGFATPVDNTDGVVPVVMTADPGAQLLDVRLLAARVQRSATTPLSSLGEFIPLEQATAVVRTPRLRPWREPMPIPRPVSKEPILFAVPEQPQAPIVRLQERRDAIGFGANRYAW